MKTLYLECNMGAAGDMLMAALLELLPEKDSFIDRINHIGIPGVCVTKEAAEKCGVQGTRISVVVNGGEEISHDVELGIGHVHEHHSEEHHYHRGEQSHHHTTLEGIVTMIDAFSVTERVKKDAIEVYTLLAEAEATVHGKTMESVHFHEVGMLDAIADIVGVCMLMEEIAPEQIIASPVHVGSGQVKCAHGILPVPAPATANILNGMPTYGGEIKGELCTPTGAALLKYYVNGFGSRPVMVVNQIGYGMGKKDFPAVNCVRAFLGETNE